MIRMLLISLVVSSVLSISLAFRCSQFNGRCAYLNDCFNYISPSYVSDCLSGTVCCTRLKPCASYGGNCLVNGQQRCYGSVIGTGASLCGNVYQHCCRATSTTQPTPSTTQRWTGGSTQPPQPSDCGKPKFGLINRIVGGTNARKGGWPWQISLRAQAARWKHTCGGSIIGRRWIVTAAHCFRGTTPWQYKVRVGEHDFSKSDSYMVEHQIERIITHPDWRGQTGSFQGDLVLIKTKQNIQFNNYVGKVCLADPSRDSGDTHASNRKCWATGWGMTNGVTQQMPNILQQLNAPIVTAATCAQEWPGKILNSHICFATGKAGKSACRGDSGGPLVCDVNNKFYLMGVTSWGRQDCRYKPGIFTRVTSYVSWIKTQLARYGE